ncbi:UDP-glucose 4-epimerase GalE [Cellulomonas aerilata]|uniref:UDP-glucose 4-epimerase GalE n=1 Tax=Cellulomonas aerilata TaxID=515326 RepID=UPI0011BF0A78|nr:UDP-glucose 4-epimerase GalE [Cellulomonas aerilata]
MTVLVTGGAGYIGAHIVRTLQDAGTAVVVADDLSTGVAARVPDVPMLRADLSDRGTVPALAAFMTRHDVDAVVHMSGLKRADESVAQPVRYYQQNVGQTANVLLAMEAAAVRGLVFSSSAAVYGETTAAPVRECDATRPVNPYGATKLACEDLLRWAAAAGRVDVIALRYFNVAGADRPELADTSRINLLSILVARLRAGLPPVVYGDDYPTPDGTCVRDYVHVQDLADAHILALRRTTAAGFRVFNIGTGTGTSVLEMVAALGTASGCRVEPVRAPRRPGDPAFVVASAEAFARATGWSPRRTVDDMVRSTLASVAASSSGGSGA